MNNPNIPVVYFNTKVPTITGDWFALRANQDVVPPGRHVVVE